MGEHYTEREIIIRLSKVENLLEEKIYEISNLNRKLADHENEIKKLKSFKQNSIAELQVKIDQIHQQINDIDIAQYSKTNQPKEKIHAALHDPLGDRKSVANSAAVSVAVSATVCAAVCAAVCDAVSPSVSATAFTAESIAAPTTVPTADYGAVSGMVSGPQLGFK